MQDDDIKTDDGGTSAKIESMSKFDTADTYLNTSYSTNKLITDHSSDFDVIAEPFKHLF